MLVNNPYRKPVLSPSTLTAGDDYLCVLPAHKKGAHIVINVSSGISSTNKIALQLLGITAFEDEYLLFDGVDITTTGIQVFKIAPYVVQNVSGGKAIGLSDFLPDQFKVRMVHATSAPITYSISINFV